MKIIINTFFIFLISFLFLINHSSAYDNDGSGTYITEPVTLVNPLGTTDTPNELIGQLINGLLGIVGSLALAMFIYGGFTWMTAAGANEKVQKGKDIIIWAVLGLIVVFSAYAVVKFVIEGIAGTG